MLGLIKYIIIFHLFILIILEPLTSLLETFYRMEFDVKPDYNMVKEYLTNAIK
jgi:hypothetical protein